jgi:pimeloyl-ACP methyl ester carboxylesterase
LALVFAATYPNRVDKLILFATFARLVCAPDYPIGITEDVAARLTRRIEAQWGSGDVFRLFIQHAPDPETLQALWRWILEGDLRGGTLEPRRRSLATRK